MHSSQTPPENQPIKGHSLLAKFGYAASGIVWAIRTQINMRIHLLATLIVIMLASCFRIQQMEWCLMILCCTLVISLEIINSSLEVIVDRISPEYSQFAKLAKDAAAGAVLMGAIGSLLIGLIIFLPHLQHLLTKI